MRYKLVGNTGLRVSELALGTMTFGTEWGWGSDKDESRKIFETYVEAGGNFIDTANRYTNGTSETFVGEFIRDMRERIVLATKFSVSAPDSDVNASGNHRKNMVQAVEASLKRLDTDYIDLYWVHIWDFMTPIEEVMRALDDLVRAGKVLYVGISDTPAWIVSRANAIAELRGWTPFSALQLEYSLIERTAERELLPMARALDLAVTPWAVLGAGVLTGKYSHPKTDEPRRIAEDSPSGRLAERNLQIAAEVIRIAEEIGQHPSQVALNWVRRGQGNIIPIIGARTVGQLQSNLGCLEFELSEEHVEQLNDASRIELGFPHDFWAKANIQRITYSGKASSIDHHRADRWMPIR